MKTIYQTRVALVLFILTFLTRFSGLAQAPTITNVSPMSGTIGTLITITGSNFNNGTIVQIGSTFAIVVATTPSELKAMVMPQSTSNIITVTAANGVVSTTVPFVVETRDEPNLQVETKKVGTGAVASSEQGNAVAISADGNTAIVGGRGDAGFFGAAWIYVKQGNSWVQQGNKLVGTGTVGGFTQQGYSVALSADGNTAAIGGIGDNSGIGAVWVFVRTGSTWSQQGAKLVGSDAVNFSNRGYSLSMSADGNTIVTGAPGFNSELGSAFVFVRNGTNWTQQGAMLQGTGAVFGPRFGESVSISANGNTIAIGGPKDNGSRGAVWIFTRSGGIWSQQGLKLVGTQSLSGSQFGISLSLSADGNTVLVGGWQDGNNGYGSAVGASWVFVRSGGVWSQQGNKLIGTGFSWPTYQGRSVSLSADGNLAMIGGFLDNSGAGAVWFFKRSGTTWTQSGSKMVGTGATGAANQGTSLALSADGLSAIVGGPLDNSSIGAAWFFASPLPPPSISSFSPQIGSVGTPIRITGNRLNEVTAASVGGVPALLLSSSSTELVVMAMPGSTTGLLNLTTPGGNASSTTNFTVEASRTPDVQQGGKIRGTGALGTPFQGYAVALSADGNTAIVGGVGDNSFVGAAWIFIRNNGIWEQQGEKLIGVGSVGAARQSISVALSADGNTAAIGGHTDNANQGAVWIFTRTGNNWIQQGSKLVGTGNQGSAWVGGAIALSANGNTLIAGGRNDNVNQGAAWVFVRNNGIWSQQGTKLFGTGVTGNAFQGSSVAISADGNTVAVGGTQDNLGIGASWVFTRSGGVWTQQGAKLVGTTTFVNNQQGCAVALSADGNTLAVGGQGFNSSLGATWIFTRSAGLWSQQGNPLSGSGSVGNSQQGVSVSLSADGNSLAVGGFQDASSGAVWMFNRVGSSWIQFGNKLQGSGAVGLSNQGFRVALSADGNTMLTGGYGDSSLQGAAWLFTSSLALPLTLLDFKVKLIQNQHARLSWETSFEEDVSHFELQQSADGRAFATIGKVKAKGIGGQRTSYQHEQPNLSNGKHYFKLKMVDIDGKFSYSKTVMLQVAKGPLLKVYPNPASQWIVLEGEDIRQVILYNQLGVKCLDHNYLGQTNIRLSVKHLSPGVYTLWVINGTRQVQNKKLVIHE
jgi:hypothetical protein